MGQKKRGKPMPRSIITKGAAEALQLGKNGSYSNEGNVLQHVLYDNLDFNDATVRANGTFFTAPQDSAYMGGNKTDTETNMVSAGQLPNTQTFLIKEISFALIPNIVGTDTDILLIMAAYTNIMQASRFEIKIQGREFDFQAPGSVFLPPMFAHSQAVVVDATSRALGNVGGSYISTGWVKLASTPIPIGNLVGFSVRQATSAAAGALGTILDTASDVLNTQNAQTQCRLRGVLTRSI
jgi:hypothetical protein